MANRIDENTQSAIVIIMIITFIIGFVCGYNLGSIYG